MTNARRTTHLMLAVAGIAAAAGSAAGQEAPELVIAHVTVIDGSNSAPRADQTVVVRGNRIVSVGPATTALFPGATVVDGRGRFLIPGLWDMHVHTDVPGGRGVLALYVANGVTGVRDMAGGLDTLRAWQQDIAAGRLIGPRIVAAGPYLEGGDSPIPHILVRDTAQARAGVDSLVRLGAPFVKVHGQLRPETYFAIARRARERGIPFAGHVPNAVGALAASDSGQRSIEHMLAIPAPCTPAESLSLRPRFPVQAAIGRCTARDLAPLYEALARNGTWVTPTLAAAWEIASWPGRSVPGDSLAHYLPDTLRRFVAAIFPMPDSISPGSDSAGRAMFAKRQAQVAAMRRAGVGILTGTDAPLRNSPPGFGLHEELALLAQGGMSNFEVLRAATLEAARYLAMTDSLGTIAPGMIADLVLLDANPLENIANTRRIAAVIANGRLFEEAERRRLLMPIGQSESKASKGDLAAGARVVIDSPHLAGLRFAHKLSLLRQLLLRPGGAAPRIRSWAVAQRTRPVEDSPGGSHGEERGITGAASRVDTPVTQGQAAGRDARRIWHNVRRSRRQAELGGPSAPPAGVLAARRGRFSSSSQVRCVQVQPPSASATGAERRRVSVTSEHRVYCHAGLLVASELSLPWTEGRECAGEADVMIRLGAVPPLHPHADSTVALSFENGDFSMSIAGVARYTARHGRDVVVDPASGARPEDVILYLAGAVFGALRLQRGVLSLHANAVLVDGACLLFAGRSGAGKSTLAARMTRAGFPLVTDDVSVLTEAADGYVGVWPTAGQLKLTEASLSALGEDPAGLPSAGGTRGKRLLAVHSVNGGGAQAIPVRRFYLLDWHDGAPSTETLSGLDATDAVAGHTYCAEFVGPLGVRARWLRQAAQVAGAIAVRRLRRPRALDQLDAVIDVVLNDARAHENGGK